MKKPSSHPLQPRRAISIAAQEPAQAESFSTTWCVLANLVDAVGHDVVDLLVGRPDGAEVGLGVEQAEKQAGVAAGVDRQVLHDLAELAADRRPVGRDRPERGAGGHHDLVARQGRQHRVTLERLGHIGDGPSPGEVAGDQRGEVVRRAEIRPARVRLPRAELEDQHRLLALRGVARDQGLRGRLDPGEQLAVDRLLDDEPLAGDGVRGGGLLSEGGPA